MPDVDASIVSIASEPGPGADRAGSKAATLAVLRRAGLPVPDAYCITADAYRAHVRAAGLADAVRRFPRALPEEARRLAVSLRIGLVETPLDPSLLEALARAYADVAASGAFNVAVRSSALCEDLPDAGFAGQFETFLGLGALDEVATAVRACWASLWSNRALRYAATHGVDPDRTAMALILQRMVSARAAGGALSITPDGDVVVTAAWGLGPAVAQGQIVPDRYVLTRACELTRVEPGRKEAYLAPSDVTETRWHPVPVDDVNARCLSEDEAIALARATLAAEAIVGGPVEIEWALDATSIHILQARPLAVAARPTPAAPTFGDAGLTGQPAGVGSATGRARIVESEGDLALVGIGEVLVTRVPGPALSAVLNRVVAVVAELGGSTSHLAALARERGIPAVLGVADATRRIPDGALVSVDGVVGVVRWNRRS